MQHEHHRVPSTALAHWKQRAILAGSGHHVQIHDLKSESVLQSIPVFTEQAVHGITAVESAEDSPVVVWGGRLLRQLKLGTGSDDFSRVQHEVGEIAVAKDWILDAAIEPDQARMIAIITAHNALTIAAVGQVSMRLDLQDMVPGSNCILYCAQVTWLSPSSCLIASGTAFGDIVVWSCNLSEHDGRLTATHQTHYTFSAHDGSVFGLQIFSPGFRDDFVKRRRVLASCSDDRTIRLWDITDLSAKSATLAEQQRETGFGSSSGDDTAAPSCLSKTMGHISRIWHVKYVAVNTQHCLLSFGEDATCITWIMRQNSGCTIDMQQTHVQRAHSGKHIWSAAVDYRIDQDSSRILTGGADGAISVTDFTGNVHGMVGELQPSAQTPAPYRSYGFISQSEVVAITDDGTIELLTMNATQDSWQSKTLAISVDQLSGYSTISSASDMAIFAGKGQIYYYTQGDIQHHVLVDVKEKVASLFNQHSTGDGSSGKETRHSLLVTTVKSGCATWHQLRRDGKHGLAVALACVCELPAGFVVTSSAEIHEPSGQYLILGSRSGCVVIYALPFQHDGTAHSVVPLSVISGVHGVEAITSLQHHSGELYSTGRDGTFAAHRVDFALQEAHVEIKWSTVHQLILPFGPNVEGLHRSKNGPIWVWGFRGKQFVVFNMATQCEVMTVECGGAHRSFTFRPGTDGGAFLWTKASALHYQHQQRTPYLLLNSGGHGREIKASAMSPKNPALVATGAEDTNIKFLLLENGKWRCLHTLQKHITGIQHLQWSQDGIYLFSSGGVEEFYVWRVTHDLPTLCIGVVCESAYPRSRGSDLRIMNFHVQSREDGFDISMVYSNSTVQKWHYLDKTWTKLGTGDYLTACLTQCLYFSSSTTLESTKHPSRLLTASTDGHLVTWTPADASLTWHSRHKVHQSAILSVICHKLPRHGAAGHAEHLLISGGDDNAIGITRLSNNDNSDKSNTTRTTTTRTTTTTTTITTAATLLIPQAHAAAVTAVGIVKSTADHIWLVSSSIDQRIKLWRIDISAVGEEAGVAGISIELLQNVHTAVADVSSMEIVGEGWILVCGVGMDLWAVDISSFPRKNGL